VPDLAEQIQSSLAVAVSELNAHKDDVDEKRVEILRKINELKLTQIFLDARQIEIGREISTN
jgi:hypothetical protein